MEGEISKSMGVDIKPVFKFEINGYWIMLDPNADEATVEQVQNLIKKSKTVKQTCNTCKYVDNSSCSGPCETCSILPFNKCFEGFKNNWEAKQ